MARATPSCSFSAQTAASTAVGRQTLAAAVCSVLMVFSFAANSEEPEVDWAQSSRWDFSSQLLAQHGPMGKAELDFHDAANSNRPPHRPRIASLTELGLPRMLGGDTQVLYLPPRSSGQGLILQPHAPPNGVFARHERISNYTLIMDVYWPDEAADSWRPIYQTDLGNRDDAELFVQAGAPAGLGINNGYQGAIHTGRWHRIAIAVQAASGPGGVGQIHKFIDGVWVGAHMTPGVDQDNRWALRDGLLLFAGGRNAGAPVYIANLLFTPEFVPMQSLERLGGAHATDALRRGRRGVNTLRARRSARIVAHRGNSCCAPENTLSAISQALDIGVYAIEVDVRLTRDGHAILMHDDTLDRTTNGKGLTSQTSLASIKSLDAGSWFSSRYHDERVPTLSEALRLTKGKSILFIDAKDSRLAPAIAQSLRDADAPPDAIRLWEVKSEQKLKKFQKILPASPYNWGTAPPDPRPAFFQRLQKLGVIGFEIPEVQASPRFLAMARQMGMEVTVYTLYDPVRMLDLIDQGVYAIETDFPAQLQRLLPMER